MFIVRIKRVGDVLSWIKLSSVVSPYQLQCIGCGCEDPAPFVYARVCIPLYAQVKTVVLGQKSQMIVAQKKTPVQQTQQMMKWRGVKRGVGVVRCQGGETKVEKAMVVVVGDVGGAKAGVGGAKAAVVGVKAAVVGDVGGPEAAVVGVKAAVVGDVGGPEAAVVGDVGGPEAAVVGDVGGPEAAVVGDVGGPKAAVVWDMGGMKTSVVRDVGGAKAAVVGAARGAGLNREVVVLLAGIIHYWVLGCVP